MKKLVYFAFITMLMVWCSCSEYDSDFDEEPIPAPTVKNDTIIKKDTIVIRDTVKVEAEKPDTTTVPEPEDPTIIGWSNYLDRTFKLSDTKGRHNPAVGSILVQNQEGEEHWEKMEFDFIVDTPDTLWLSEKPATVYRNAIAPAYNLPEEWNTSSQKNVEYKQTFNTNNYSKTFVLNYKFGFVLVRGAQVYFKPEKHPTVSCSNFNVKEVEITKGNKIYRREISDLTISIKIEQYTLYRTTTTVIDNYLRDVEENKEPEVTPDPEPDPEPEVTTPTADFYEADLLRFVSSTKVFRDDTQSWSDAYLFETKDSYVIVLDNFRVKDGKEMFVSREYKVVSKSVCPESSKYNAVLCHSGKFYPGLITPNNGGWVVASQPNGGVLTQSHSNQLAVNQGIKNFRKDNTAEPTPFVSNTPEVKEINGYKWINVVAQTSTHTRSVSVADKNLK